jgi:phosphate-selective porin OprO/OprP
VRNPFSYRHGGWGAWELAARYSDMQLDFDRGAPGTLQAGASIRGGEEKNLTAGINWYWNPLARLMLEYQHVQIDRLSPASSANAASAIWLTPAGAQIGQDFNVWSVRSQFAF